jgi:hypothetical protein
VSREDKKMSYSFTGGATYITENQKVIYSTSECVTVKYKAANKMTDHLGKLYAFVTLLV